MNTRSVVFDFISCFLNWEEGYLHCIDQLLEVFPKLETCDFVKVTSCDISKNRYTKLYHGFMLLFCSRCDGYNLCDTVNECLISEDVTDWNELIMLTYFYFKHIFPAALVFYTHSLYKEKSIRAQELIFLKFSVVHNDNVCLNGEYDLAEVFQAKLKFLNRKISLETFDAFNIINNVCLTTDSFFPTTKEMVTTINEVDANHILQVVYPKYSGVVSHRRIKICKSKNAQTKYAKIYKLRYQKNQTCEQIFILFTSESDLLKILLLHNVMVDQCSNKKLKIIAIPTKRSKEIYKRYECLESFYEMLTRFCSVHSNSRSLQKETIKEHLEKTGFISLYDVPNSDALAYVKNRVVHFTASFKKPPALKPRLGVKNKLLVTLEKVVKTMTITRYKTETFHDNNISFNVNYQGPLSHLQFMVCKFVNENVHLGCFLNSAFWVSNVCTTTDTVHAGIQNTHTYREQCLQDDSHLSYPMMNFPAMVTFVNNTKNTKTNCLIKHRTSINTSRIYGKILEDALANNVKFLKRLSEHDETLTKLFYKIETHYQELLSRNVMLLIHLLYIFQAGRKFNTDDILNFFERRFLYSRMLMTTSRSFSTVNTYIKKFKSDANENTSIKSSKFLPASPPTIFRQRLFQKYKKHFSDLGSINTRVYRPRGRNAILLDLILNSKDRFFFSDRCNKLLTLLLERNKRNPMSKLAFELLLDYQRGINGNAIL